MVVMGSHIQNKLRLALGTMKDHASIGKAMICRVIGNSNNSSSRWFTGIEIAVVRATKHDSTPIDDKHMHEILFLVSNAPPGSVPFLAERISHRLDKTRDRNVALKTLMLVHRLLRGGDRYFEQDLRNAHLSGHLQIMVNYYKRWRWCRSSGPVSNLISSSCRNNNGNGKKSSSYKKKNDQKGGTHNYKAASLHLISSSSCVGVGDRDPDPSICFLLNYAAFLEERMGWVINQAGKLEPITTTFQQVMEYHHRFYELDNSIETLVFRRLPKYQAFLDRVLDCSPALRLLLLRIDDGLTRAAMNNILKETFQVYMSFCEGVTTLLDSFFDFKNPSARLLALQLLSTASRLTYQLSDFFKICKRIVGTKNLDYPTVQVITSDYVLAMEPFLLLSPSSSSSSSSSPSPSSSSSSSSSSSMNNDSSSTLSSKTTTNTTTSSSSPSLFWEYFSDHPLGLSSTNVKKQFTVTIPKAKIGQEEEGEEATTKQTSTGSSGTSPSSSSSSSSTHHPFSCSRLETKISNVWVVFNDEEEYSSPNSNFSIRFGRRNTCTDQYSLTTTDDKLDLHLPLPLSPQPPTTRGMQYSRDKHPAWETCL